MDVKRLLRKRSWTGEETGKALILDLIHSFKQTTAGSKDRKPLFESSRITEMIGKFRASREEVEAYNKYVNLQHWVVQYQAVANANLQRFNASCNELISIHNAAEAAENEFRYIEQLPRIVTQKQYDDMKARRVEAAIGTKEPKWENVFTLIIRAMLYYGAELEVYPKKANPMKAIKKLYKDKPLQEKTIIEACNDLKAVPEHGSLAGILATYKIAREKFTGELKIPETKWDVIDYCVKTDGLLLTGNMFATSEIFSCIYGLSNKAPRRATPAERFEEITAFRNEFPELVTALIKSLDALNMNLVARGQEVTKPFAEIPIEEWEATLYAWHDLYDAGFPGFREWVESDYNVFSADTRAMANGVAIVRPSDLIIPNGLTSAINEKGYYVEPDMSEFYANMYGLNAYLPGNENSGDNIARITKTRQILEESLRILIAYDTSLELIADEIGIPDFTLFKMNAKHCLDRVKAVNGLYKRLYEHITGIEYQDIQLQQDKVRALLDVFPPFDLESFEISDERKAAASKMLEALDAFGEGRNGTAPGWNFLALLATPEGGMDR